MTDAHLVYEIRHLDQYKLAPAEGWVPVGKASIDTLRKAFKDWERYAYAWSNGAGC